MACRVCTAWIGKIASSGTVHVCGLCRCHEHGVCPCPEAFKQSSKRLRESEQQCCSSQSLKIDDFDLALASSQNCLVGLFNIQLDQ